jgi:hypothetical protein
MAEGTLKPAHETIQEIRDELARYGEGEFVNYERPQQGYNVLAFQAVGHAFLLCVPLPDPEKYRKDAPPNAGKSTVEEARRAFKSAYEQEKARLLRVVYHLIRAKLAAVDAGVTSLAKEFFADLLVWNSEGKQTTVFEWYAPQVEYLKQQQLNPPLFPALEEPKRFKALMPKEGA